MTLKIAALVIMATFSAVTAFAHEIGETRVLLRVGGGKFDVTIVTAPTPLLNRLELSAGQLPSRDIPPDELERRLITWLPALSQHLAVAFDKKPAPFTSTLQLRAPADPLVPTDLTIRLEGAVPADARGVQWTFDLPASLYVLSFDNKTYWLEGGQPSPLLPLAQQPPAPASSVFLDYIRLGFAHIVPAGPDHVLFVLGLIFGAAGFRPLAVQITAFTLAHSVTLFLATEDIITVSPAVVEPLIALSIAVVALENLLWSGQNLSALSTLWRPTLVFCFGLLHGLGFAGVLSDVGLPPKQRLLALFGFNLGIETAQLFVVLVVYTLLLRPVRSQRWYRKAIVWPASSLIGLVGLYWAITRIVGE